MKRLLLFAIPILFALSLFGLTEQTLYARSGGFTGRTQTGCAGCHRDGTAPEVALAGTQAVLPNSTTTYQLLITSTTPLLQTHAGFDLTVLDANGMQAGTLQTSDADAQISESFTDGGVAGELTHRRPKANANGVATVDFQWTAPITQGTYTVYFVGNSVNRNGDPSGDAWAANSAEIQVSTPPTQITLQAQRVNSSTASLLLIPLIVLIISTTRIAIDRKRQPK